ncbi:MAG: hypothetical protein U1E15_11460 [Hyphomicrobiales bacterium]
MKQISAGIAAILLSTVSAHAADLAAPPAPEYPAFDIGFEGTLVTDYMDSGFTNSDHKPAGYSRSRPATA